MAQAGIMSLPMGGDMQEGRRQGPLQVSSADSYDAAKTALGMVDPQSLAVMRESLRQNIAELDLSSEEIDAVIDIFEYMTRRPDEYPKLVRELEQQGVVDPGDLPEDYDPALIGTILSLLNEMRLMRGEAAMAPMQMGPGAAPMGMAEGGLADVAQYLASKGRRGDTMLAHITPEEAQMLERMGGSGTINPETGLPEYFLKKAFKAVGNLVSGVVKGVVNVAKKVLASPVGRIAATIGLAMVLGPTAIGMTLGQAGTAALASGAVTLASGGNLKQALVSGALGYIGGGGDFGGLGSPLKALGGLMPGAAGSALNTGLTTGALGTGAGLLMGMKPSEALKMGATSGLTAAALQGLGGAKPAAEPDGGATAQPVPERAAMQSPISQAGQAGAAGPAGQVGPIGTAGDYLSSGDAIALQDAAAREAADFARFQQGMPVSGRAFTGVQPQAPGTPGAIQPPGLIERTVQGAKDIYNEYLSPSRPGLPADAGILTKYGPLALAGTAAIAAAGGMKSKPADESPLGLETKDYLADRRKEAEARDRELESAGYTWRPMAPTSRESTLVPTPSFSTIPVGGIPVGMPTGITNMPGGVPQPYNVSGLYGVPLLYGQQPPGRAKGGEMTMRDFPRKTGPINGPGTGTSDSIPAMLSDGEFVFTAKAVRNAGNGSRRKGAARMYKLMKMLEGGPVKGK
jgi:hypothetical protein